MRTKKKLFFYFSIMGVMIISMISGIMLFSKVESKSDIYENNNSSEDDIDSFSTPLASESIDLNWSFELNQSTYLPYSTAKAKITINNNLSLPITSAWLDMGNEAGIDINNLNFISNENIIDVNETFSHEIEFSIDNLDSSLDLVILFDASGSMGEEIKEAKSRIFDIIDYLSNEVAVFRISIIIYGSTIYGENPLDNTKNIFKLSQDYDGAKNFLNQFIAGGSWEPWGDSLTLLEEDNMNWESDLRLAIIIGDEPCNGGYLIGDLSHDYYFGEELWDEVKLLKSEGVIISSINCYGGGTETSQQFQRLATETGGKFSELNEEISIVDEIIATCEEILDEYGSKLEVNLTIQYDNKFYINKIYPWIVKDGEGPGFNTWIIPLYTFNPYYKVEYRLITEVIDVSGVENVTLNYYFENDSTNDFSTVLMNKSSNFQFFFNFGEREILDKVIYYQNSTDKLGNPSITEIYEIYIDNSTFSIGLGEYKELIILDGEFSNILFEVNIEIPIDIMLVFSARSNFKCTYFAWNDENHNLTVDLNLEIQYYSIRLDNFNGKGMIIISHKCSNQNEHDDNQIKITIAPIYRILQNAIENSILTQNFSSIIYEYEIPSERSDYWHFYINTTNQNNRIYNLAIFNSSDILKTNYYDRICAIHYPGIYYLLIQNFDQRFQSISYLDITVQLKRGYIDDDSWSHSYSSLPPWFYMNSMVIGVIAVCFGGYAANKALKLTIPYVLRMIDMTKAQIMKNKKPVSNLVCSRYDLLNNYLKSAINHCGIFYDNANVITKKEEGFHNSEAIFLLESTLRKNN